MIFNAIVINKANYACNSFFLCYNENIKNLMTCRKMSSEGGDGMPQIRRERVLDTFAAHKEERAEYGSKADTVMRFALKTKYDVDTVRKERKLRQFV